LTTHGVLQARRLAAHLASTASIQHIFSSDLERAAKTALAVADAASPRDASADGGVGSLQVVQDPDLRERDFGSAEGKRWLDGEARVGDQFVAPETHEQMRVRAERFVLQRLKPLIEGGDTFGGDMRDATPTTVVVVAHGLILGSLLRVLLRTYAPSELARLAPPASSSSTTGHLGIAWSNTGYVEIDVKTTLRDPGVDGTVASRNEISLVVLRTNVVDHLVGLKKTRGGIGSAKFDSKQKTVDSFFRPVAKKPRAE